MPVLIDSSAYSFLRSAYSPPPGAPKPYFSENKTMNLTLYSASWCRDCREAKRFLTTHNIPYKEIDIETTPGAADLVIANTGKRAIPQFVLDGKWIQPYKAGQGFLYDEMSTLFGVAQP
jgi:mycoredoxin